MRRHDVIIIGSGSGNSLLTPEYDQLDVGLIDGGTFGGTCINVGCIPTKMYVYPAEVAQSGRELGRLGVTVGPADVDWPAIRDRIFGRIDAISAGGLEYRKSLSNVTVYQEYAHFTGPKTLVTASGEELTAPVIVVASGSRVTVPRIPGIDLSQVHTSDTVMRLPSLPERIVIVGGGYIAAEFAHVFHGLGSRVTQLNRSTRLLRSHDAEIAERFRECASSQWDLQLGWAPEAITDNGDGSVTVRSSGRDENGQESTREDVADIVLMATGRRPNTDLLNPSAADLAVDPGSGLLRVDEYQRVLATDGSVLEGVWALGDVSSPSQLKHVANHEARVVAHNALHPDELVASDHRYIPSAVFTHPEIAAVGMTEEQAREWADRHGTRITMKSQAFGDVAYGWAMEDRTGICKVIADGATGELLGAHLIGPHSSILIQPLIQAMSFGLGAHEMARGQYWIHPSLAEVVENALLGLELD
ncbi:mycothione reductase [Kocuria coralli]|uniref:Mycothione reductase n=1 Tax=Kocuria coralli TaxID=1461025 RepID=A0A5J5KYR3_9MICC|nr:mycothione reductase [Kocuria coralli]KAA9394440.1 mycothione reductase [Kocuria coralli]